MNGRSNLFFVATASLGSFLTNKSFAGVQYTNSRASNPDAMGAIGPNHFVEILNATAGHFGIAIFDKCTGEVVQSVANTEFFAVQHQGTNVALETLADPRILYDPQAQRWVACTLAQTLKGVRARDQSGPAIRSSG